MKKDILGVKIDDINMDQSLQKVAGWLSGKGKRYIVTPNPELIVMAQVDKDLKEIINNADLAIPDGIGLKLSGDIDCHIPGIDMMERIIKLAADKGYTTGFLGGREGVAKKTAECLRLRYPNLKVSFASSGGEVDIDGFEHPEKSSEILRNTQKARESENQISSGLENSDFPVLRNSGQSGDPSHSESFRIPPADILFVAFGQPKQEKWIARNLDKIPVKAAMGVGGAFDYLSGTVPRAPRWIRDAGLEWLFRLVVQPWRIKRQLALVKFIFYMIK